MSTKFFTNQDENTLLNKIEGIFKHRNIFYFDALVGYFRASGYFRVRQFIDKASKIRILVGINVDQLIVRAQKEGLQFGVDVITTQEEFLKDLKKNIQDAEYSKPVEDGMLQMIQDIISKKVEIRVHPSQNIHAKVYIFREQVKHEHGYGAVITGSSNLTEAGLARNFEFNVELRENADIDFATETFDRLWSEGVPVANQFVEKLKKETYLNDEFTPFEIYMKFLIEFFGKSIEFDPESITDLPKEFKRLSYQIDAVNDGFNKLMKHNGFFLADVVGLGKTIVATLIAKKFFYSNGFPTYRSRILVVVPPALEDNWERTIRLFNLDNCRIITNGSLHKVRTPEDFDLIIVDEAHKFRTDTAEMYNLLQKICKSPTRKQTLYGEPDRKKVMLVSATPLNNRPEDIANQVYLFQDAKDSTIEVSNLQHFFRQQIDRYKKSRHEKDLGKVREEVKLIYEQIRKKVLEPLTVRRTRTDLRENESYAKDIKEQGIVFPAVEKPRKILYPLDSDLEKLYDNTIHCLSHPTEGFTYNRYRAIGLLKPHKKAKYKSPDLIAGQLARIMKTLLVKRIDSSFFAFKRSLGRFKRANEAMIKMFEKGAIYIAPNLKVTDFIMDDKEDELIEAISVTSSTDPTIEVCAPDDFEPSFLPGLQNDQRLLEDLVEKWGKVSQDPKLDEFVSRLNGELFDPAINRDQRLVVFSESKETAEYLEGELRKKGFTRIVTVDSSTREERMPIVRANFDANIPLVEQKSECNILISTEVLAEGINLNRSNIVVNYDTPWNSTKLMQRIGRVNRIGSVAGTIYVYNFFPTARVENDIELHKISIMKLQAFHSALGEDSQIYSMDEEPGTFGLFDRSVEEEERDERLVYLMKLRKFREDNPELFKTYKNMPLRARAGRKNKVLKDTTISFIRNKKRDAFYFCKQDGTLDELTFVEAVKQFEAKVDEKALPLHDHHHDHVRSAVESFGKKIMEESALRKKVDPTQGPNEKKALAYLDAFVNLQIASNEEKARIALAKQAIKLGTYQNLQRDINKLQRSAKSAPVKHVVLLEKIMKILNSYPLHTLEETPETKMVVSQQNDPGFIPEIIISESYSI